MPNENAIEGLLPAATAALQPFPVLYTGPVRKRRTKGGRRHLLRALILAAVLLTGILALVARWAGDDSRSAQLGRETLFNSCSADDNRCAIGFDITNTGGRSETFVSSGLTLVDAKGKVYRASTTGSTGADGVTAAPGETVHLTADFLLGNGRATDISEVRYYHLGRISERNLLARRPIDLRYFS